MNRTKRIESLGRLYGVAPVIYEHHNGYSARINDLPVTRQIKGRTVSRWRSRRGAEKVLLDELKQVTRHPARWAN